MIAAAVAAILPPLILGMLAAAALSKRLQGFAPKLPLLIGLAAGVGFGISSSVFFFTSLLSPHPGGFDAAIEMLVALTCVVCIWRQKKLAATPERSDWDWRVPLWILGLATVVAQACVVASVIIARTQMSRPYGGWDAWAIWNLHARMMFLGAGRWPGLLQTPQIAWSHPDYPLLLPAAAARAWEFLGADRPGAPAAISICFSLSTLALLIAAAARLRGLAASLIGALVLLGTPFFVTFSTMQYADIPLGYFILGALVLLVLSEHFSANWVLPLIAGGFAGTAAWTKNEGWLFVLVAVVVWSVAGWKHGSIRRVVPFLCGLGAALVPVLFFKIVIAPPNDLLASRPLDRLAFLFDGERHRLILTAMCHHGAHFGDWRVAPYLVMLLPLLGGSWRRLTPAEWGVGAAILLMLVGYYAVFLLTPKELTWHLENSIDRLFLQLWPATILFWCLAAFSRTAPPPRPEAIGTVSGRDVSKLALFSVVNLFVACVLVSGFGRQLAPNELAATRDSDGELHALVGAGWFGREEAGRDTWAWSGGNATLRIVSFGRPVPSQVTLRFGLRCLSNRAIAATIDGRTVWRSRIGRDLSEVAIDAPLPNGGPTDIVFSTDGPGVRESPNPMARSLAFALYNLRLERKL